jgi:hypothetical protein
MAPIGEGKGGGRMQNASGLRQDRKKKGGPAFGTQRIENAKMLRDEYGAIFHSIDGVDPAPQTVPKCVECKHCGWPVYPRESRVATRKTFEKAGIEREDLKQSDAKLEKAAAEKAKAEAKARGEDVEEELDIGDSDSDGEQEEGSVASMGTAEALENKVTELTGRVQELEAENEAFQKEVDELKQHIEDLEEALAAAEEKIELLEESERRWREKNSILRMENDDHRFYINQLGAHIGDLETDMCGKITEIQWRKVEAARVERRRALMLVKLEDKMRLMEGAQFVKALFKVWQEYTEREDRKREREDAEDLRRRQTGELRDQLTVEKQHVFSLEATATRLRGSLKAAAHRMLAKVFSTTQKPWATGHALTAWVGAHPAIRFENRWLQERKDHEDTHLKLNAEELEVGYLDRELTETTEKLNVTTTERDKLATDYALVLQELQTFLGAQGKQADDVQKAIEAKAEAARLVLSEEIWAEAKQKMDEMNKEFDRERTHFQDEIGGLEAQMESLRRGLGMGGKDSGEEPVVPKGQGILCVGCLRQIVNRGVQKLPQIVNVPKAKSPARPSRKEEDKARKKFFEQELQGMPDVDDMMHTEAWKARRDPMAGMRYTDFAPDVAWHKPTKSASASRLSPLRSRPELNFKPCAFR